MSSINVGDKVKRISGKNHGMQVGDTDIVISVGETAVSLKNYGDGHAKLALQVISSSARPDEKPTMIKKLNIFIKKHLDPKVQELLKAGYYNGDLLPTSTGDRALLNVLHMEYQDKLAALAKEENDAAEAEANKK